MTAPLVTEPRKFCKTRSSRRGGWSLIRAGVPLGGLRGFRWGRNVGCYVTQFAPDEALKLIA